jgi:hypothetical protein
MKPFKLAVVFEVLEFIQQLSPSDRQAINRTLIELRESPEDGKHILEREPGGREIFVHLSGKFALKFWIDVWEREVKVIAMRFRERR